MNGEINWTDLQNKKRFKSQNVMMHGSRLNDLSGVAFTQNNVGGKISYILYNPWAVQTPGMLEISSPLMKLFYKILGKPIDKAVIPIVELLDNPPKPILSAYRERKEIDRSLAIYNAKNAKRLYGITTQLLEDIANM